MKITFVCQPVPNRPNRVPISLIFGRVRGTDSLEREDKELLRQAMKRQEEREKKKSSEMIQLEQIIGSRVCRIGDEVIYRVEDPSCRSAW